LSRALTALMQPEATQIFEKNQVQVIARAASILRELEHEPGGLSLGQIASRVGLARSTVQRIVGALETEKLLAPASPNGRVRLGPGLLRLARSMRTDSAAFIRPYLEQLSRELSETVDLAEVQGDKIVFIDQVIGPQRLRTVSAVGESFPLHCTANGKAYLAQLDDDEIVALIGRLFEVRTANTIGDIEHLIKELRKVRKTGVAFDREEHTLGISAGGVAFVDPHGNALAISVPVPAQRFSEQSGPITRALLATKLSLEREFGGVSS
jgi:DNA-binding IclR family transcriptional regulator